MAVRNRDSDGVWRELGTDDTIAAIATRRGTKGNKNTGCFPVGKTTKKKGSDRHALPVVPAIIAVIVCKPLRGLRITRRSCGQAHLKETANASSISPCRRCSVGKRHAKPEKKGRPPSLWDDGSPIETTEITVPQSPP